MCLKHHPSKPTQFDLNLTLLHQQALGLIRDVVHLEFDSFSIVRKVSAACEPDLGPGDAWCCLRSLATFQTLPRSSSSVGVGVALSEKHEDPLI